MPMLLKTQRETHTLDFAPFWFEITFKKIILVLTNVSSHDSLSILNKAVS